MLVWNLSKGGTLREARWMIDISVTVMSPVYDGRPDDSTGEHLLPPAPAHQHLEGQEAAVVLTVDTDLLLINWIDGRDGS